ncbi:MAG: hypothetical protein U0800_00865 [Isosphaeraceae bacterium]
MQPGTLTVTTPVFARSAAWVVKRGSWVGLSLAFSGGLDASSVRAAKYRLATPGRDGRYGTRDDQSIKLGAATFDVSTNVLTIPLARPLKGLAKAQFRASGLTDTGKIGVVGKAGQLPGGDLVLSIVGRRIAAGNG